MEPDEDWTGEPNPDTDFYYRQLFQALRHAKKLCELCLESETFHDLISSELSELVDRLASDDFRDPLINCQFPPSPVVEFGPYSERNAFHCGYKFCWDLRMLAQETLEVEAGYKRGLRPKGEIQTVRMPFDGPPRCPQKFIELFKQRVRDRLTAYFDNFPLESERLKRKLLGEMQPVIDEAIRMGERSPGIQPTTQSSAPSHSVPTHPPGSAPRSIAEEGEWLTPPTTKKELARRLNMPIKKAMKFLENHGLKKVGSRQLWTVRIDLMPKNTRSMLEESD